MDITIKDNFIANWEQYFHGAELPIVCYYSDELNGANYPEKPAENSKGYTCILSQLLKVRKGVEARAFNADNFGCMGSSSKLGFIPSVMNDDLVHFLTNIECSKIDKDSVMSMVQSNPHLETKSKYLICKRWDMLTEVDTPQVVTFFAPADIISALHMLAYYDYPTIDGVISPWGGGCEATVGFAMKQELSGGDKCVLGLFDVHARRYIKADIMTFSAPYSRFVQMVSNMGKSFLNTFVWGDIKERVK